MLSHYILSNIFSNCSRTILHSTPPNEMFVVSPYWFIFAGLYLLWLIALFLPVVSLQVGNLGLLFMLLFFIFAALGVELFGDLSKNTCTIKRYCAGSRKRRKWNLTLSFHSGHSRAYTEHLTLPSVGLIYLILISSSNSLLKYYIDLLNCILKLSEW